MDIGDIIEHDVEEPVAPTASDDIRSRGFPVMQPKKSKFLARSRSEQRPQAAKAEPKAAPKAPKPAPKEEKPESEAERIHRENLEKIKSFTPDQFVQEREELLEGIDPSLLQGLLKRAEKRTHNHKHAEGYEGWIGGGRDGAELPHLSDDDVNKALGIKSVKFDDTPVEHQIMNSVDDEEEEPEEDGDDEIAPPEYQLAPEEDPPLAVHFPKPKKATEDPELDINDPNFLDKLHEKYYPDLPKETSKLAWMKDPLPQKRTTSYDAISDMRFDFQGNLVEPESQNPQDPATHLGLHHHSADPHLPGYTLAELARLARSVVPTQRSISLQTLGRILHKLGLHKYNILPIPETTEDDEAFNGQVKELLGKFESMMWDHIEELRIIDTITEAADEKMTRNLSVRNYAIEALWLWKQGGGRPKTEEKSEEDILAEQVQKM